MTLPAKPALLLVAVTSEGNKVDRTKSSDSGQVFGWKNDQQKLVVDFK